MQTWRGGGGRAASLIVLKLLVTKLRQRWPQVRIVFRGDSGFCRQRILNYCERFIVGLARNARLQQITEFLELSMKDAHAHSQTKQPELGDFQYAANTWSLERRVTSV